MWYRWNWASEPGLSFDSLRSEWVTLSEGVEEVRVMLAVARSELKPAVILSGCINSPTEIPALSLTLKYPPPNDKIHTRLLGTAWEMWRDSSGAYRELLRCFGLRRLLLWCPKTVFGIARDHAAIHDSLLAVSSISSWATKFARRQKCPYWGVGLRSGSNRCRTFDPIPDLGGCSALFRLPTSPHCLVLC